MSKDCFTRQKRSEVMRAVGRRDTAAELRLRHRLWHGGLRYRKHVRIERTCPDIAFVGAMVAVFVDGCFWHGCPEHYTAPVGNADFWREKVCRNRERDRRDTRRLEDAGWAVVRVWECEVNYQLDAASARVKQAVANKN